MQSKIGGSWPLPTFFFGPGLQSGGLDSRFRKSKPIVRELASYLAGQDEGRIGQDMKEQEEHRTDNLYSSP